MYRKELILAACLTLGSVAAAGEDWPRWAGPRGDFSVPDPGLAVAWGEGEPRRLWSRPLGEGYSGVAAAEGRLFTQYSRPGVEVVVALSAATGQELWTHQYAVRPVEGMRLGHGKGPHATALVDEGRLFTVGTTAVVSSLAAETGELLWRKVLWEMFGAGKLRRGYGSSPVIHDGRLVLPVGGEGGVVALDPATGELLWHQPDLAGAQSTPLVVSTATGEHLVLFAQDEVVGLDPRRGDLLWRVPHESFGPYNISTPLAGPDGLLFVSSAYGGGAQGIRLASTDGTVGADSAWRSGRLSILFTNAVRLGGHVYGSSGRGTAVLTALDLATGELAWRSRAVGRANLLVVGERVLALEEDGRLLLVDLSPAGLQILAEARILEGRTWTMPTLVGRTLYVRDEEQLVALELPLVR